MGEQPALAHPGALGEQPNGEAAETTAGRDLQSFVQDHRPGLLALAHGGQNSMRVLKTRALDCELAVDANRAVVSKGSALRAMRLG